MECTFTIFRFDPEKDSKPSYKEYKVWAEPTWRILDCLNEIKWNQDGTLTFRRSCAHGVCGSDAMKINRACALACQVLVQDYKKPHFLIEPLPTFAVIKDLAVDLDPFFRKYERIRPYFANNSPPPQTERLQSIESRKEIDDAVKCILCASCTSSCPSNWYNPNYLGPAALLKAYRFIFDSRDEDEEERIRIVNDSDGIWRCHAIFNCTEVCPKEIEVTEALSKLKRRVLSAKL